MIKTFITKIENNIDGEWVEFEFEFEMICELIEVMEKTPNDMEFGTKVRRFITEYQELKSEKIRLY